MKNKLIKIMEVSLIFIIVLSHAKSPHVCLRLFSGRTVNNSRTESSPTSTVEASSSSSTGPSLLADAGLDLSSSRKEEADLPLRSQSQFVEDKDTELDTKKDQQFG